MTAADRILQKALVASPLDTAGWSKIQAGIRDRAFFSATVEDIRVVGAMRDNVVQILQSGKSQSEVRRDMREYFSSIGVENTGSSGLKNIYSKARLDVMMRTNCDMARGYVSHLRATTPGAILAFPAYELVRVEERKMKRDWRARWAAAASKVAYAGVASWGPGHSAGSVSGRMIALKTSPIWTALSRFGDPFPPFDFNSGMGVRDVAKSVCREIGLLRPDEQPEIPPQPDFNANLTAQVPPESHDALRERLGDQVAFDGNVARFVEVKNLLPPFSLPFNGKPVSVMPSAIASFTSGACGEATADLIPSLLREGGTLDLLTGGKLKAVISNNQLKEVKLS